MATHYYGGQLRALHAALVNPLVQRIDATFAGDSITWGSGVPGTATSEPRSHALTDARNNFASPCYVNEFKRYIGRQYFDDAPPALSNWPGSPSGEATAEYSRELVLYPGQAPFTTTPTGASLAVSQILSSATPLGQQYRLTDANTAGTSYHSLTFPFTGEAFTLVYASVAGDPMTYEVLVDGISQGVHETSSGVTAGGQEREHAFPFVRDAVVEIRTRRVGATPSGQSLRIEAIKLTKRCRITNQGINGATFPGYKANNLGAAGILSRNDQFVFLQLGTNDRGSDATPYGVLSLRKNAAALVDAITPAASVILMAAGPAELDTPPDCRFRMSDVRAVLSQVAQDRALDFIDHYAAFDGMALADVLADGLHPNTAGSGVYAANLQRALESA